jgi:hypothetical protein
VHLLSGKRYLLPFITALQPSELTFIPIFSHEVRSIPVTYMSHAILQRADESSLAAHKIPT